MANRQHIEWFLEGVVAWNNRRESTVFEPNFEGANLYGECLRRRGIDPSESLQVERLALDRVNLANANLKNVDLRNADLNHADFSGSDLSSAILRNTNLRNTDFRGASLNGADLSNSDIAGAKLYGAGLADTNFARTRPWTSDLFGDNDFQQGPDLPTCIENVGNLMNVVSELRAYHVISGSERARIYFRGEGKCGWDLEPSVMRLQENGRTLTKYEGDMLRDLMSRRPEEFSQTTSALEEWVLAQHYKLPTRFLDVSSNPLVALFNACEDEGFQDENGRVHIFVVPESLIKAFNSDSISIISNFAKLKRYEQKLLLGYKEDSLRDHYVKYPIARRRLYQGIKREKPYFAERIDLRDLFEVFVVEPQRSPDRMRAQSGAFLVSAFHERFERENVLRSHRPYSIPLHSQYELEVPSHSKDSLIQELQQLNITEEALYPGLESSTHSVKDYYIRRSEEE